MKQPENSKIAEKIREITDSKELPENEKVDRLRALIPADVFKIEDLNKATPAQLIQLNDGLAVAEALHRLNAEIFRRETGKREPA
jgi:DNA polymerase/3'-5' exonuclease PolX